MANCTYCAFTDGAQETVDAHVANLHPEGANAVVPAFADVAAARTWRYGEIERKGRLLVEKGFEYPPASGRIMGLSQQNQLDILVLCQADYYALEPYQANIQTGWVAGTGPGVTWPVVINNKDNSNPLTIASRTALRTFYLAMMAYVGPIVAAGAALKIAVAAAETIEAVLAIEDNR